MTSIRTNVRPQNFTWKSTQESASKYLSLGQSLCRRKTKPVTSTHMEVVLLCCQLTTCNPKCRSKPLTFSASSSTLTTASVPKPDAQRAKYNSLKCSSILARMPSHLEWMRTSCAPVVAAEVDGLSSDLAYTSPSGISRSC